MKEFRKANIIPNKDGHGSTSFKINVPKKWADDLGFKEYDREAFIEINDNKIIIRKAIVGMLLIKKDSYESRREEVDYELENGVLLFLEDWNGEIYRDGWDSKNQKRTHREYKPIYRFEEDNIDINELEENSDEWYYAVEIIGFEEI